MSTNNLCNELGLTAMIPLNVGVFERFNLSEKYIQ